MFNLAHINIDLENKFEERSVVMTAVHELFHVLGFSKNMQTNFHLRINPELYPNLQKIKDIWTKNGQRQKDYPFIEDAHWNFNYLPNDLMTPFNNVYSDISPSTLEYLELSHPNYITDLKMSHQNFFATNFSQSIYFKCKDNEFSSSPYHCSEKNV